MERRDRDRLEHMREAAHKAAALASNRAREDLETDETLALSLARLLEIVGEAANQLSPEARNLDPEIPWSDIIGMRHRLIHAYFHVNLDIVWQTVTEDLPPLIGRLDAILAGLG